MPSTDSNIRREPVLFPVQYAARLTGRLHDRKTVPADPTRDIASTAPPKAATARLPEPPGLSESVADVLHGNMSQL